MIDDGLFDRFGKPAVVLGQHVAPIPAGFVGLCFGPAFAASDALKIIMYGRGAHGSRPEVSVDPVVMAAATVMRLQTVVSREVPETETAVLTIDALRAGTKGKHHHPRRWRAVAEHPHLRAVGAGKSDGRH